MIDGLTRLVTHRLTDSVRRTRRPMVMALSLAALLASTSGLLMAIAPPPLTAVDDAAVADNSPASDLQPGVQLASSDSR